MEAFTPTLSYDGTAAMSFDSARLTSLIKNRGSRMKLNLAGYTMSQVLVAYEQFKKKISPNYRNGNTQHQIKRLEEYLGLTIMPEDICDDFYVEAFNFLSTVPNAEGKIVKPSTIKTYFTNLVASLSWASKHGCQIDPSYNVYKIASYEQPKVALTPCQISHIYHFDLNNKENRQKLIDTMHEMKMYRYAFGLIERVRVCLFLIVILANAIAMCRCSIGQTLMKLVPSSLVLNKRQEERRKLI